MIDIQGTETSYALLSSASTRRNAVVFVHGFLGDAVTTWHDFQRLIDTPQASEWWAERDLYFYGYPTKSDNVAYMASNLRDFVSRVFPSPARDLIPSSILDQGVSLPKRYTGIVLVGHSLGGVILRQFLGDAALDYEEQERKVLEYELSTENDPSRRDILEHSSLRELLEFGSLRLFAPADFGFYPTHLPGFCYHLLRHLPIMSSVLGASLASLVVHEELSSQSARLRQLHRLTERVSRWFWIEATRANVLFGQHDHIVHAARLETDLSLEFVDDKDHTSICKPSANYFIPLEFVQHGKLPKRTTTSV